MEIIIGKYAGFCPGVENTIKKAEEVLKHNKVVYCLGEIIHNEYVVNEFIEKGMIFVNSIEEVPNNSKLIFRAHGETKQVYLRAREKGIEVIDLTCLNVSAIHKKVEEKNSEYFILIIGKKKHPETIGTKGFADNSYVIEKEDDVTNAYENFKESTFSKIYIISQTTINKDVFDYLVNLIKKTFKDIKIVVDNTICNATKIRQKEVEELSKSMDKIIIVGGKNSSNTKELYNIAIKNCNKCILISDNEEIDNLEFKTNDRIGIVAGASTPKVLIKKIEKTIKSF